MVTVQWMNKTKETHIMSDSCPTCRFAIRNGDWITSSAVRRNPYSNRSNVITDYAKHIPPSKTNTWIAKSSNFHDDRINSFFICCPHVSYLAARIVVIDCKQRFYYRENTASTAHSPPSPPSPSRDRRNRRNVRTNRVEWDTPTARPQIDGHFGMQAFIHALALGPSYLRWTPPSVPTNHHPPPLAYARMHWRRRLKLIWYKYIGVQLETVAYQSTFASISPPPSGFIRFDFAHRFAITVLLPPTELPCFFYISLVRSFWDLCRRSRFPDC